MSERQDDPKDSVVCFRDAAEMEFDEQFWSEHSGNSGSGGGSSGGPGCSGTLAHIIWMVIAGITFLTLIFFGIYFAYNAVSNAIRDQKERTAKEAYFEYVQTLEEEILSTDDYIAEVNLDVEYGYKDEGVQYDYITINIKLLNSFEDLSVVNRARVLYGIDSYIMETLAAAQEETGYIEVLERRDGSTYNKIYITFETGNYQYYFGGYETVKSKSYSELGTSDLSRQFGGYVGYLLTWEDGEITAAKQRN